MHQPAVPSNTASAAVPRRASRNERVLAGAIALACLALLTIAASLKPDARGHGTHEQLALPPCGWALTTGLPCATCGMTTAFASAATADPLDAAAAQPMGFLLALGAAAGFWICLHTAATGSRLAELCATVLLKGRVLWILAGLWGASWVFKVLTWDTPA